MQHSVVIPGKIVHCEWDEGLTSVNVHDGVDHFCASCGTKIPAVRDPKFCQDVCPGHHERYGAGENLRTAINWCPGVERADTQEVMWWE